MTVERHYRGGGSEMARASDEERVARAFLLRIGEPGDPGLAGLVSELGVVGAVDYIRSSGHPDVERWIPRLARADGARDLASAAAVQARLVVPGDDEWPAERLLGLRVEPLGLWVRGELPLRQAVGRSVAIVGSRASTTYGEHVAAELAADLATAGWTVVSGGAYGIDGAAHRAVLAVGGVTVAVLANGVDNYYPRGHEALLHRVSRDGLVVTELSPGERPTRVRFLERNRVIAALALGTVAVEMALRSGAATTMDRADSIGRIHMAVPGPITSPMSAGCHYWINHRNAALVTSATDVLALVAPLGSAAEPDAREEPRPIDALGPESLRLWEALPPRGTRPVADLAAAAGIAVRSVGARLEELVMLGLASSDGVTAARTGRSTRAHGA
jgi:DNA processing protein